MHCCALMSIPSSYCLRVWNLNQGKVVYEQPMAWKKKQSWILQTAMVSLGCWLHGLWYQHLWSGLWRHFSRRIDWEENICPQNEHHLANNIPDIKRTEEKKEMLAHLQWCLSGDCVCYSCWCWVHSLPPLASDAHIFGLQSSLKKRDFLWNLQAFRAEALRYPNLWTE